MKNVVVGMVFLSVGLAVLQSSNKHSKTCMYVFAYWLAYLLTYVLGYLLVYLLAYLLACLFAYLLDM